MGLLSAVVLLVEVVLGKSLFDQKFRRWLLVEGLLVEVLWVVVLLVDIFSGRLFLVELQVTCAMEQNSGLHPDRFACGWVGPSPPTHCLLSCAMGSTSATLYVFK